MRGGWQFNDFVRPCAWLAVLIGAYVLSARRCERLGQDARRHVAEAQLLQAKKAACAAAGCTWYDVRTRGCAGPYASPFCQCPAPVPLPAPVRPKKPLTDTRVRQVFQGISGATRR